MKSTGQQGGCLLYGSALNLVCSAQISPRQSNCCSAVMQGCAYILAGSAYHVWACSQRLPVGPKIVPAITPTCFIDLV